MTVPRVVRPLYDFLGTPRGNRLDANVLRYSGHSPYSYLYGLEMSPGRRRATPYRPPLALTTIGRKSGRLHTVGLAYFEFDGEWVLVGSGGGSNVEPHWVRNSRANPAAWVHLHRRTTPVLAEVLDGDAKQPFWTRISKKAPIFDEFQASVDRDIPLVVLRPRGS
jgi:deazaflavin-dependent oxidoreductase (nitroreductase family)